MPKHTKQPTIIGYRRDGSIATDPREALLFGWSEKALPRHGGGSGRHIDYWKQENRLAEWSLGETAPEWLIKAEYARREALRKERGK
jgi:hypothetical protein